ncbi:MAG: phage capsid protein [Pseudonocardiaceae bacterium]|nr:MAG: phage capsid protein [Pseudonocardiaceae bacterium]
MAIELYADYVTPAELTGYARGALADRPENQFQLLDVFPAENVPDLNYRFNRGTDAGLLQAAAFRAFDAEPGFGKRDGLSRVTGELPAIGQQYTLGEYDQLKLRNAEQEVRDLLLRDAVRIARQIETRFEIARGQALVEGKVTIAENDVYAEVDFGRSSSHSVAPSTLWSVHATATPLDDLQSWRDTYVATNGAAPGRILTSTAVRNHLLRCTQIIEMIYPLAASGSVGQVTVTMLNQLLSDFDLPAIEVYDAQVKTSTGTTQRVIAADKLIFLPPAGMPLGATLWGLTLEAQEPEYGIGAADQPGIVVGAFKQKTTPITVFTVGSAIGLPIMANPDATLVADVA